jgi:hypothetical protein
MSRDDLAHITDDDLTLYYYGEHRDPARIEVHLASCAQCAGTFNDIVATLALVDHLPEPDRDERYGLEVWQRLRPSLPPPRGRWNSTWRSWPAAGLAAAAALLLAATFAAGRYWPAAPAPIVAADSPAVTPDPGSDPLASERARVAAIADHLERSERVLLDLTNDAPVADVPVQAAVRDLLDVNRLYREAATEAGDSTVASVLDDLERALLDIVHAPTTLTAGELAVVRARLDAAALLFKIRILSHELRDREAPPIAPRKTT